MLHPPSFHRALREETYASVTYGAGRPASKLTLAVNAMCAAGLAALVRSRRSDGLVDVKEFVTAFCKNALLTGRKFLISDKDCFQFVRVAHAVEKPGDVSAYAALDKLLEYIEFVLYRRAQDLAIKDAARHPDDTSQTIGDRTRTMFGVLDRRPALSPFIRE